MRHSRGVVGAGAVGLAALALPLLALLIKTPWSRALRDATAPAVRTALRLSLECSLGALLLVVVLGTPLAYLLSAAGGRLHAVLRAVVVVPLVLPPVVGGIALLLAFGRRGLLGPIVGDRLAFSTGAAVLAEAFVAAPFYVLTVEAALRAVEPGLLETAATLGASPRRALVAVTLPAIRPALAAGAALAWARALGEFGATVTFAGSLPGRTRTLPLAAYETLQDDPGAATVTALLLVAVALTVLLALRSRLVAGVLPVRASR